MTIEDLLTWRNVAILAALSVLIAAGLWRFGIVPWWAIIAAPAIAVVGGVLVIGGVLIAIAMLWMGSGSH